MSVLYSYIIHICSVFFLDSTQQLHLDKCNEVADGNYFDYLCEFRKFHFFNIQSRLQKRRKIIQLIFSKKCPFIISFPATRNEARDLRFLPLKRAKSLDILYFFICSNPFRICCFWNQNVQATLHRKHTF